jgi:hypothetical protein
MSLKIDLSAVPYHRIEDGPIFNGNNDRYRYSISWEEKDTVNAPEKHTVLSPSFTIHASAGEMAQVRRDFASLIESKMNSRGTFVRWITKPTI